MNTVEEQFNLYLERAGLSNQKMSELQLRETKRAFYGAWGQFLLLYLDIGSKYKEEDLLKILDNQFHEVGQFWTNETTNKS